MTSRRYLLNKKNVPYVFIVPSILFFLIFAGFPIIYAFYLSFHNWNVLNPEKPFVALTNYKLIFQDDIFVQTIINTAYYTVGVVTLGTIFSMICAIFVNAVIKPLRLAVRTIAFIPVVTSMVAAAIIWKWIYQPMYGLANYLLEGIGLGPYMWLRSTTQAMPAVIIMSVWKGLGFSMVIFLAGLQNIPEMYYEAARIDGANPFHLFRHITLPLLRPTILFVMVTGVIGSFQVFTQIFIMTNGGPGNATRVLVQYIYESAFRFYRMGLACSMAFVLFGIVLFLTILQIKYFGRGIEF